MSFPSKICVFEPDFDLPYDNLDIEKDRILAISDSGNNRVIISKVSEK